MSAIAAVFTSEAAPAGRDVSDAVASRRETTGAKTPVVRHFGPVSLAYWPYPFLISGGREQIARDPASGCAVVFDGAIDNRREIATALDISSADEQALSDADLVLRAYERWERRCPQRLVGGFAFALWDPRRSGVLCARDPLGVRQLFYTAHPGRFAAASQVRQLVDETPKALDEEYVADYLAWGFPVGSSTPYPSAKRLLAGHALWFDGRRATETRYWDPGALPTIDHRDERRYAEEFYAHFLDAVGVALHRPGVVMSELSGGLDSSSIVCALGELVAAGRADRARGETLSVVYDEAHLSDEREWSRAVVQKYGFEPNVLVGDGQVMRDLDEATSHWDEPSAQMAFFSLFRAYGDTLRQRRASVLLSGIGAEAVMTSESPEPIHLSELLLSGRLPSFVRELVGWQRALHVPLLNLLIQGVATPIFAPSRNFFFSRTKVADWISPSFADRMRVERRLVRAWAPRQSRNAVRQFQLERLWRISGMLYRGYLEQCLPIRYPFLHQPFVEYMLQVPFEFKARPGESKALLRQGMSGVLPEEIRSRRDKRGPGHAVYLGIDRSWTSLEAVVRDPVLADHGIVDREKLFAAAELARQGCCPNLVLLMSILALEFWTRHAFKVRSGMFNLIVSRNGGKESPCGS